jgi:hypothetical protein
MQGHEHFQLRRLQDDLLYHFDRQRRPDESIGYKRRDQDLWIIFLAEYGWVAVDEVTGAITGRPWNSLLKDQTEEYPPEGEWVSKKGIKSYVYELKYTQE